MITPSIAAMSQEGYCDSGYGLGVVAPGHECGRVEFVVPQEWKQMNNCASPSHASLLFIASLARDRH